KYLSEGGDQVGTENVFETDLGDQTIEGNFSNWNRIITDIRDREYDVTTDTWNWIDIDITDSSAPKINKIDIPIRNGESVQFRIKSVSEAGWPDSPIESDWSNTVTIDFPEDFNSLFRNDSILQTSIKDESLVEMTNNLETRGVYRHIQDQFENEDNFFAHKDEQISTSFKNNDGTFINLRNYLEQLNNRITSLEEEIARTKGKLFVKLISNQEEIQLTNNSVKNINITCEDYMDNISSSYYRVYANKVYLINDYSIRVVNGSQSNPLGLLSDRKYEDIETGNNTNFFYKYPDSQTLLVDDENNLKLQNNNQFIWFSDNHKGDRIHSGITETGKNPPVDDDSYINENHLEILQSNYNIGYNSGDTNNIIDNLNLLDNVSWTINETEIDKRKGKFEATIHPNIDPIDSIVEEGQEKIKEIKASEDVTLPINIYFKPSHYNNDIWVSSRGRSGFQELEKKVKIFIEKEGEARPFQTTLNFKLRREKRF
ncbi:MAG: hypothetical protein ACOCRK_09065, partial [bacterium]